METIFQGHRRLIDLLVPFSLSCKSLNYRLYLHFKWSNTLSV